MLRTTLWRTAVIPGLALALATVTATLIFKTSKRAVGEHASYMLVAARDLEVGTLIKDSDLLLVKTQTALPFGVVAKKEDAVGQGVVVRIPSGEPLPEYRLASKGALICCAMPRGMRAVALVVGDNNKSAGFSTPGMHVDVVIGARRAGTLTSASSVVAKTLIQNVTILSFGQDIKKNASGKPAFVNVINIFMTEEQAKTLELATRDSRVQVVLRNPVDKTTLVTNR